MTSLLPTPSSPIFAGSLHRDHDQVSLNPLFAHLRNFDSTKSPLDLLAFRYRHYTAEGRSGVRFDPRAWMAGRNPLADRLRRGSLTLGGVGVAGGGVDGRSQMADLSDGGEDEDGEKAKRNAPFLMHTP